MLTKKDLAKANKLFSAETHNQQESSDYKRGVRSAMLVLFDLLHEKGKHDTADMLANNV